MYYVFMAFYRNLIYALNLKFVKVENIYLRFPFAQAAN